MTYDPAISLADPKYAGRPSEAPAGVDLDAHQRHSTDEGHAHPVPKWMLIAVFVTLLILTAATVAVRDVDLGPFNIVLALGIAVAKAAVVALFFMHLYWDSPFNALALIFSIGFVALFIGIAILDTGEYQPQLEPPGGYAAQPELTGT